MKYSKSIEHFEKEFNKKDFLKIFSETYEISMTLYMIESF